MSADDLFGPVSEEEAACEHPVLRALSVTPLEQMIMSMGAGAVEQAALDYLSQKVPGAVFHDHVTGETFDIEQMRKLV